MMLGIDIAQNVLNIGVKDNLNVKSSAKPSFDKVLSNSTSEINGGKNMPQVEKTTSKAQSNNDQKVLVENNNATKEVYDYKNNEVDSYELADCDDDFSTITEICEEDYDLAETIDPNNIIEVLPLINLENVSLETFDQNSINMELGTIDTLDNTNILNIASFKDGNEDLTNQNITLSEDELLTLKDLVTNTLDLNSEVLINNTNLNSEEISLLNHSNILEIVKDIVNSLDKNAGEESDNLTNALNQLSLLSDNVLKGENLSTQTLSNIRDLTQNITTKLNELFSNLTNNENQISKADLTSINEKISNLVNSLNDKALTNSDTISQNFDMDKFKAIVQKSLDLMQNHCKNDVGNTLKNANMVNNALGTQSNKQTLSNQDNLKADNTKSNLSTLSLDEKMTKDLKVSEVKVSSNESVKASSDTNKESELSSLKLKNELMGEDKELSKAVASGNKDNIISLKDSLTKYVKENLAKSENLTEGEGEGETLALAENFGEENLSNDFGESSQNEKQELFFRNRLLNKVNGSNFNMVSDNSSIKTTNDAVSLLNKTALGETGNNLRLSLYQGFDNTNAKNIADKVMQMSARNLREVEIVLSPEALGKMKIKIDMNELHQAKVSFQVSSSMAKDILSSSMDKLKDSLENTGITLAENSISQDLGQNGQSEGYNRANEAWHKSIEKSLKSSSTDWLNIISDSNDFLSLVKDPQNLSRI